MLNKYFKHIYKTIRSVKLALGLIITLTLVSLLGMLIPQRNKLTLEEFQIWQNKYPVISNITASLGLDNIFSSPFFLIVANLFLVNTVACTIKQFEVLYKQLINSKSISIHSIENLINKFTVKIEDLHNINLVKTKLKSLGFNIIKSEGKLYGYKRKLGYWGSPIFHIGIVLIIIGVFISFTLKTQGRVELTEGQIFSGSVNEYIQFKKGALAKEPKDEFKIGNAQVSINANANENLIDFSSNIVILDNNGQLLDKREIKTNKNLRYHGYTFYPYDYGYSPAVVIEEKGSTVFSAFSSLEKKKTGDKIEYSGDIKLEDKGWVIRTTFIPNILKEGNEYQPKSPAIMINIKDFNGNKLFNSSLSLGQETKFDDYTIKFPDYRRWIGLIVVHDPGVNLIFLGSCLALIGLILLYFWVPQEIFVLYNQKEKSKEITLSIGGKSKKYSVSFSEKFQELKDEIVKIGGGKYD